MILTHSSDDMPLICALNQIPIAMSFTLSQAAVQYPNTHQNNSICYALLVRKAKREETSMRTNITED